jgi:hypothetical protein
MLSIEDGFVAVRCNCTSLPPPDDLSDTPMDSQTIELLGRNRLTTELLLAGLEVALPARDRGIDLIAYVDLTSKVTTFTACPIQMKASSSRAFSIDQKYARISNLILAYVWGLQDPAQAETFALTYPEAISIAEEMGWTTTESWAKGAYSTSSPSKQLCTLLQPFRMTQEGWWTKVAGKTGMVLR